MRSIVKAFNSITFSWGMMPVTSAPVALLNQPFHFRQRKSCVIVNWNEKLERLVTDDDKSVS